MYAKVKQRGFLRTFIQSLINTFITKSLNYITLVNNIASTTVF